MWSTKFVLYNIISEYSVNYNLTIEITNNTFTSSNFIRKCSIGSIGSSRKENNIASV